MRNSIRNVSIEKTNSVYEIRIDCSTDYRDLLLERLNRHSITASATSSGVELRFQKNSCENIPTAALNAYAKRYDDSGRSSALDIKNEFLEYINILLQAF